ncbi:PKD domain-containing protein [Kitasatospora cinereorecta]|uniref:PKD domain-containing protein n=1 Tax=Kitasatospora cinereorecta TaxID=285560 RepID=A0ABW0V7M4_9ACTN
MRLRQSAALVAAAATTVLAFPAASFAAGAEAATTLYVNGSSSACSDSGSGTADRPFCHISPAAAAVLPGQTVQVAATDAGYQESVHITRSGTADQPITFLGVPLGERSADGPPYIFTPDGSPADFVITGVHDVVIRGFSNAYHVHPAPTVTVADSSRITLDRNAWYDQGSDGVRITGASDHVTVSRNLFARTGGVSVGAGVHDSLITGNDFNRTKTAAVTATDAPGLAVTGNTMAFSCMESVKIDGTSPGALIENNVITADHTGETGLYAKCSATSADRGETEISLSAASTTGSKVDYNTVHPFADASAYTWGGTAYRSAAAFNAATGQAGHDVDLDLGFAPFQNWPYDRLTEAAAAAVDSADPTAPGADTDLFGVRPGDDPKVANTAPGGSVRDRGAYELTGLRSVSVAVAGADVPSAQGPAPFTVRATATAVDDWGVAQADYAFDFGDGSGTVHSTNPVVTHTYASPGTYGVQVVVTDPQGAVAATTTAQRVEVKQPGDLTVAPGAQLDGFLNALVTPTVTSPYVVTGTAVDFGDGFSSSTPVDGVYKHQYSAPGSYTVTVTATDEGGRTTVGKQTLQVDNAAYLAALQPGLRVQVLGQTLDGQLLNSGANYSNGTWAPFLPVRAGGVSFAPKDVSSMAAATTADQYLRAFALVNGKIYNADRNLGPASGGVAQGQWLPWKEVSGMGNLSGITQISAASIGNSTHLVAVANGRVYESSADRTSGTWSAWGDVTGVTGIPVGVKSIAAGTTGNALHIAILGSDGHLRVADGDYNRGRWSYGDVTAAYGSPAGMTQVAAASTPGSRFHVVVLANGRIHETTGDYAQGYWTGWGDISAASGLSGLQQITAASTGNTIRIFGNDGTGYVRSIDGDYTAGRWSSFSTVNTPMAAGSTAPITTVVAAGL